MQALNITLDDAICEECNSVWLSRLERAGIPITPPPQGLRDCTRLHTRMPRPCTRVKERKGRGIRAFARCLLA